MIINGVEIEVVRGSVLDQDVDAVVNAANPQMRNGGGLNGAVHAAAGIGMTLELANKTLNPVEVGEPVVTSGHKLKQKYIIHVAGPMWRGGHQNERLLLAKAYANCLKEAENLGIKSIAFCSISTGIYHFPIEEAAQIAWDILLEHAQLDSTPLEKVIFAMHGESEYLVFSDTFEVNFRNTAIEDNHENH